MMEFNTTVAGIPASRQKNCNACVQAKRRCDRRALICSRCMNKKIPCIYGKIQAAIRRQPRNESVEAAPCMESLQFGSPSTCSFFAPVPSLDMDYFGVTPMDSQLDAATAESLHTFAIDATSSDDSYMDSFIGLLDNSNSANNHQWLVQGHGSTADRPISPADNRNEIAYQKMARFCDYLEPWQLYDPKTRLYYIVNRVKGFTFDVAARNATPFMHRYLYKDHMPPCILECFTTSVLYVNRTSTNMAAVMHALHHNVVELAGTETGRAIVTPTEKLARTQALFLYQIIRLFDGDVTLRAQGEKDIPLLQTWLGDLCKVRENLGDLAELGDSAVRPQQPKEWERWIYAECVRRTIIMAYSVITLYEMMNKSEEKGTHNPWVYTHRWTLSRHLWEADSLFKFARMWKEKPHHIINNYSFEDFLKHGRGDDVDEFAEILLSVYVGVDETKEFIATQETKR